MKLDGKTLQQPSTTSPSATSISPPSTTTQLTTTLDPTHSIRYRTSSFRRAFLLYYLYRGRVIFENLSTSKTNNPKH